MPIQALTAIHATVRSRQLCGRCRFNTIAPSSRRAAPRTHSRTTRHAALCPRRPTPDRTCANLLEQQRARVFRRTRRWRAIFPPRRSRTPAGGSGARSSAATGRALVDRRRGHRQVAAAASARRAVSRAVRRRAAGLRPALHAASTVAGDSVRAGSALSASRRRRLRLSLLDHLLSDKQCPTGLLLLVDEAQALSATLLDELRVLTNLVRGGVAARAARAGRFGGAGRKLRPSGARIVQPATVGPLLPGAAQPRGNDAIRSRPDRRERSRAGIDVFAADACDAVFDATDGVPRLVNQLCDRALLVGVRRKSHARRPANDSSGVGRSAAIADDLGHAAQHRPRPPPRLHK